jgi:hypothetical protein
VSAADRARAVAVAQVAEFMRKRKIALGDLVRYGGEDLKSSEHAGKVRSVEKVWALMADLGVEHIDLGGVS